MERGDFETSIQRIEQEMIEAGRARNFTIAQQKEQELLELQVEKICLDLKVPESSMENIDFLNQKIEECIKKQRWAKAQSLQEVVDRIVSDQTRRSTSKSPGDEVIKETSLENDQKGGGGMPVYGHVTVLQAHPLVYYSDKKFHTFSLPPDFEHEKKTILDALLHAENNGGHIDVSFEPATTFRLSALLADPNSGILHYSGHGTKEYVTMENWGAMQALFVDELKEFVSTGGPGNLRFAFVSACHSRDVGQAFVDAGVSHVVCCHIEEELSDVAAIEFTRNFYLHMACGQTLSQAFEMAKTATKIAPIDQDARFILLPEQDDDYHDVLLFSKEKPWTKYSRQALLTQGSHGMPPSPPCPFIGREMEMYSVLENLKHSRFTQITGEPGVGKSALGHALCAYIGARKDAFFFENVYWLPSLASNSDRDEPCGLLSKVMGAITNEQSPIDNTLIRQYSVQIAECLRDERALLFIDGQDMSRAMTKLQLFLEVLLRNTLRVYVVLICPSGEEIVSKVIPYDTRVKLDPLDMSSSVLLFGYSCPFVSSGLSPDVTSPSGLDNLLVPKSQARATRVKGMSKRCKDIFGDIGEGYPKWIIEEADKMSEKKYLDLVEMGKRQEFPRGNYDTRFALDQEWSRIAKKLKSAKEGYDYLQAQQLQANLQELEELREHLPTLEELRLTEQGLCSRRNNAVSIEDFARANELQKRLKDTRDKLKREEEALVDIDLRAPPYQNEATEDHKEPGAEESTPSPTLRSPLGLSSLVSYPGMYIVPSPVKLLPNDAGSFTLAIVQMAVTDFRHSNSKSVIVCATNESCHPVRGSVSGAVIAAGGDAFKREVEMLESEENTNWGPVRCPTGKAAIVGPAPSDYYGDLNVPWVIFAVGPTYARDDGKDSLKQKDVLLRSAYRSSLELARKERLEAVAFSLISCGHRAGGDLQRPLRIAVETIAEFGYKELKKVQLCAFRRREADILNEAAVNLGLLPVGNVHND